MLLVQTPYTLSDIWLKFLHLAPHNCSCLFVVVVSFFIWTLNGHDKVDKFTRRITHRTWKKQNQIVHAGSFNITLQLDLLMCSSPYDPIYPRKLWSSMVKTKTFYNINYGVTQGFPTLRKAINISLVSYRVKHSKRNSISTHAHLLFSTYHLDGCHISCILVNIKKWMTIWYKFIWFWFNLLKKERKCND